MAKGVFHSLTIALLTAMVALTAEATYLVLFCSRHQAWMRVHSGRDVVMLNHQYGVRRASDALFACELIHRVGPIALHPDLIYYCAPSSTDLNVMAARTGATCTVERRDTGASYYCDEHLDF